MEKILKVGEYIKIEEDYIGETALSNKPIEVKAGETGIITAAGTLLFDGSKEVKLDKNIKVKGYFEKGLTRFIFQELEEATGLSAMLSDYDISVSEFKDELEIILMKLGFTDM